MNRREFFHRTMGAAVAPLVLETLHSIIIAGRIFSPWTTADETLCKQKFEFAIDQQLAERPINEVIAEIGKTFIGTEYVGHVLEQSV